MGRKRTIKAVVITLILTLLIVGLVSFFVANSLIKKRDTEITNLKNQLSNDEIYVFANDLKAGSVITPDDIVLSKVLKATVSTGMYFKSSDIGWEDAEGNYHEKADYYTVDEDGLTSRIPMIIDDAIIGRQVKANVSINTPVMEALMFAKNEVPSKDERLEEFNYITIPSDLNAGDYVDVRVRFATGEDFAVLVGKKVEATAGETTIYMKLNEEEIMLIGSATIEAYINNGSLLYANKYPDPGTQLYKETVEDYVEKYENGIKLAIEAKDNEKILELSKSGDIAYNTIEEVPQEQVAALRGRITPTREVDIINDSDLIAKCAGIKPEHVDAIRDAKKDNNQDVLIYYKNMRIQTKTQINRTYAVKEEVLKAIQSNPNLVSSVKSWFNERYAQNVADGIVIDKIKKLEQQLELAPEVSYEQSVKSKAQIREEINTLITSREEAVQGKLDESYTERKARRVAYLEELIDGE